MLHRSRAAVALGDLWHLKNIIILLQLFVNVIQLHCLHHHSDVMWRCGPDTEFLMHFLDFHVAVDSTQGTTTWLSAISDLSAEVREIWESTNAQQFHNNCFLPWPTISSSTLLVKPLVFLLQQRCFPYSQVMTSSFFPPFASCSACLGLPEDTGRNQHQDEACCGWTLASAIGSRQRLWWCRLLTKIIL